MNKIKNKILASIVGTLILAVLIVTAIGIQNTNQGLKKQIKYDSVNLIRVISYHLESMDLSKNEEREKADEFLQEMKNRSKDIEYISIRDTKGEFLLGEEEDGFSILSDEKKSKILSSQTSVENSLKFKGQFVEDICYPIVHEGKLIAFINVGTSLDNLGNILMEQLKSVIGFSILAIILSSLIGYILARRISKNINHISKTVEYLENGDFTNRVSIDSKDEMAILASKINDTMKYLEHMVFDTKQATNNIDEISKGISSASEDLSSSLEEITTAIENVSKGAENQNQDLEEISNVIDKLAKRLNSIHSRMNKFSQNSEIVLSHANKGSQKVSEIVGEIETVSNSFGYVNEKILDLTEIVGKIHDITEVINKIATQTNLLALNASIEAARAGEHGKGFAVVAEAIGDLAEKSGQATKDIAKMIKHIQAQVGDTVDITIGGVQNVQEGAKLVKEVGGSLEEIYEMTNTTNKIMSGINNSIEEQTKAHSIVVEGIEKVNALSIEVFNSIGQQNQATKEVARRSKNINQLSQTVASSMQQQSAGTEQVFASSQSIAEMSEQVSGASQEVAAMSRYLTQQAENLQKMVEKFKME